mgnify:CR=1 FL=1
MAKESVNILKGKIDVTELVAPVSYTHLRAHET